MRAQRKSYRRWTSVKLGFLMLVGSLSYASAQSKGSQVLRLPDPTPRELDPGLRFPATVPPPAAPPKQVAVQNEKRWELIVWATGQMVALSERADKAAQAPSGDASKKELDENVTKIESLAKNLATALKAH